MQGLEMHGGIREILKNRPKILTIAGFDPSGGAGVLADIKTFEQNKCLGFAIQTCNTIQNESEFQSVNWIDQNVIFQQLGILLKKHQFKFVKVGLIQNLEFLGKLLKTEGLKDAKFIWDPILSASTGFDLGYDLNGLKEILKGIYLITPNWDEIKILSKNEDAMEGAQALSELTKVYLKGGHNKSELGRDYLLDQKEMSTYNPKKGAYASKHGSGCVFSSALTSNLAKRYPENKAVLRSKRYVERFLASSSTEIGYHNY